MKISKKSAERMAKSLKYGKDDLLPVVAVDFISREPLMLAYANKEAVIRTLTVGFAYFFSRSRNSLWKKGETSGNRMSVLDVLVDCDRDSLAYVVSVSGEGNACHKGRKNCFIPLAKLSGSERLSVRELSGIMEARIASGDKKSYTAKLVASKKFSCSKVTEEAQELVEAVMEKNRREVVWEACDLIYHTLAAARSRGVLLSDLEAEFARRHILKKRKA